MKRLWIVLRREVRDGLLVHADSRRSPKYLARLEILEVLLRHLTVSVLKGY
jgi:hypothetical protein